MFHTDLASSSFSIKREGTVLPKNSDLEVLKMGYRYAVIEFACGSSNGNWSPGKCVIDIIVNEFVCSLTTVLYIGTLK